MADGWWADRVFLCCGDLATNGQEQLGILLPLVQAAKPWALAEEVPEGIGGGRV